MTSIAILTADQDTADRLRRGLQSFESALLLRVVRDEPDLSFRSLRVSDIVVCGYDVSRERMTRLLRALDTTGVDGRLIHVIPAIGAGELVCDTLSLGVRAVIREDLIEADLADAVRAVARGRIYLSPTLVPPVLERYRELCEQLRRLTSGPGRTTLLGLLRPFSR